MNLEDMKIKDLLELKNFFEKEDSSSFLEVGKSYLIRTVTLYYTGKLKKINGKELLLEDVAWIPDTGRFSECLIEGKFNEVEPFQDLVIVPRDTIIDATEWKHKLPRSVK